MRQQAETLRAETDGLYTTAQDRDDIENARYGADTRGDEVPDELRHKQTRLDQIRQVKARLEAEKRAVGNPRPVIQAGSRRTRGVGPGPSHRSRISQCADRHGYQRCCNGQLAVDSGLQMIIPNELTPITSHCGRLWPILDQARQTLGACPQPLLADAGYRKKADLKQLETRGIDAYVAPGREGKTAAAIDGQRHSAPQCMQAKLATPDGRERYRQRKRIAEAVSGWIKQALAFRRFSVRGQHETSGEWDWVCLATNRRMRPVMVLE